MAYKLEKQTGDLVVGGFANGIAASPHKGLGNIQNANISTEMGEVMNSYARIQQNMSDTATTGSLSYLSTDHVNLSIAGSNNLFKGNWITVTSSSNTGELPNGTYYVPPSTGAGFELSQYYNTSDILLPVTVNLLAVAGGGGGAGASGTTATGGGGGGQVLATTASVSSAMAYSIVVGAGGAMNVAGGNTTALGKTSDGGGTGLGVVGGASGSGKAGGAGNVGGGDAAGGGGGGDSAVGGAGTQPGGNAQAGGGGNGTVNSLSGSSVTYGGGGGGGAYGPSGSQGGGGSGGGGEGGGENGGAGIAPAVAGTPNTGGGGGGAGGNNTPQNGAAGGSGIVIISAPIGTIVSATGGTHTTSGGNDIWTFTTSGTWTPTISSTTVPPILTGFTAGLTATISLAKVMGKAVAPTIETYSNSGVVYHRYYILDNQNLVWVYDEFNETLYSSSDGVAWFVPDISTSWCTAASGIAVISGFLIGTAATGMYSKPTTILGNTNSTATTWIQFTDVIGWRGSSQAIGIPHFAFAGHQGSLYVTDASYIVSVFPDSALADPGVSTTENVQSFCSWVSSMSDPQFSGNYTIISGTTPVPSDGKRVPVVFFTNNAGILPYAITANTVYYLEVNLTTFNVYAASTGGSELDIQTGAFGTQYFNTFYPYGASATASAGATPTYVLTNPQVALPIFEVAQCMAEIDTVIVIGCQSNTVYPWPQQGTQATGIISLPESNVTQIITVNQMAYIFAGNKGNIYITDGAVASLVSSVPDYCAGIPGTPNTYVEPVFVWGGGAYIRGRVYFSILDQTATKAGNCGGIWSFIPTQNFYIGQDNGIAMRQENQSSYGTYNGYAPIIIPRASQAVSSPQYWSAWENSINSSVYGIDFTGTGTAVTQVAVVETDAIPTGTMLEKQSLSQIEFKLTTPLLTGDSVHINYRKNLTDVWKSCGTAQLQPDRISGYFSATFEKTQWLQLQVLLTSGSSASFVRLKEIRIR